MHELVSLAVASRRLGVHVTTLRTWVRNGTVPAYRVGQRFTRVDWNELLAAIQLSQQGAPTVERERHDASVDAARSAS
jgi:excisionase family DNA binding protein